MATCLGISVGKNLIKYAKMSKEKNSPQMSIEAYGVKFYDVLTQTLNEIIQETRSNDNDISVCVTSEDYEKTQSYRQLKPKDREAALNVEFEEMCQRKAVNAGSLDVRFVLSDDPMDPNQYSVKCVAVNKVELNNLWQALQNTKFQSISAIGPSIVNLLKDKGMGDDCLIINIEDDTKLTLIKNGQIAELVQIPVGMDEVITRLADQYNSYAKAYAACKGIDAYSEVSLDDTDVEKQQVRDALMPTLYDLKQRIMMAIEPFQRDFNNVYITGTGIIVNNIDLYLQEAFGGKRVELLVPYFVNKERNSLKDVLEVNSALAAATYCLNGIDKSLDFLKSGTYLKASATKKQLTPKAILATIKEKIDDINQKTLKVKKSSKKKKKEITFDNEVENLEQLGGAGEYSAPSFEDEVEYYDPMAEWLARIAISLFVGWIAYTGVAHFVQDRLNNKIKTVNENISKTDAQIDNVNKDREKIQNTADEYSQKTAKLQRMIDKIKLRKERSYDVPNFMSQLMFVIPVDVKVSSISIGTNDNVVLEAESSKYAQLGYFVSRLKLAGILTDVKMDVVSMDSTIKIKVKGILP